MKILVTGSAGFIGMNVAKRLLDRGDRIVGLDNLNNYYDQKLKLSRTFLLEQYNNFEFIKGDLIDRELIAKLFLVHKFDAVIHLAAQAGVRYSVNHPNTYADCNLVGFLNILEGCRNSNVAHLVFASSSSVYGSNRSMPFRESDCCDHPISLYAATKRANELMAHSYSHLYGIPVTGLRFFTVYGPWGRPDQSLFLFVKSMVENEPIKVFNKGNMRRDFTYIDDIVEGLIRVLDKPPIQISDFNEFAPRPDIAKAPYRIFNIGGNNPVSLMTFIEAIEESLGIVAEKIFLPLQEGDVTDTFSSTDALYEWVGYRPETGVKEGIERFVNWYKEYFNH